MGEPVAVAVQLPLLPSDQLDALPVEGRATALRAPRRGRPPGSKNRSSEEWRTYLLGQYRSPLVVLAETYSRSVSDLAVELGCKPVEALALQVRAAVELAPYLHSRQPVEVNHNGAPAMTLNIFTGDAPPEETEVFQVINQEQQEGV